MTAAVRREITPDVRAIVAAAAILVSACGPDGAAAKAHIVVMRGLEFLPAVVDAEPGDTITWINKDVMPHTATAGDGAWDSGSLEEGEEWLLIIEAESDGAYVCSFHPQMTGEVNVE